MLTFTTSPCWAYRFWRLSLNVDILAIKSAFRSAANWLLFSAIAICWASTAVAARRSRISFFGKFMMDSDDEYPDMDDWLIKTRSMTSPAATTILVSNRNWPESSFFILSSSYSLIRTLRYFSTRRIHVHNVKPIIYRITDIPNIRSGTARDELHR